MATEQARMEGHQHQSQRRAESDCDPWRLDDVQPLGSSQQRSPREERSLLDEAAVLLSHRVQLAPILMNPAEDSQHWKRAEKNHVAQPSIHQHVCEAEHRKSDEARM